MHCLSSLNEARSNSATQSVSNHATRTDRLHRPARRGQVDVLPPALRGDARSRQQGPEAENAPERCEAPTASPARPSSGRPADAALAEGKSVVVDNTNPSADVRLPLIVLGRRYGARIIACYFDAEVKTVLVRNRLREGVARVPDVAIFATRKKLVPPSIEEGFDEVVVVTT